MVATRMFLAVVASVIFMWKHLRTVPSWRNSSIIQRQLMWMALTAFLEALLFLFLLSGIHMPGRAIEVLFVFLFGFIDSAWIGWIYLQWKMKRFENPQNDLMNMRK